jgi:hypothetical protein
MRITVALCTALAVLIAAPWTVLGQGAPPPSQPAPSQAAGTTVEGVIANVDATCGGKPATGCQIVEVTASPAPGATPTTPAETTKIMIPKDAKITNQDPKAAKDARVQLAKGDKVKITYEKKQDGNVAISVTLVQKANQ